MDLTTNYINLENTMVEISSILDECTANISNAQKSLLIGLTINNNGFKNVDLNDIKNNLQSNINYINNDIIPSIEQKIKECQIVEKL